MITRDIFLRSHVVELEPKELSASSYSEPKWPEYALIFDTETTLDPQTQSLLFGFYRVCKLQQGKYVCVEEGILHADDLDPQYLNIIAEYERGFRSEVIGGDYDRRLHVYSRAEFVEKVFFEAVRTRSLIVAFNAPWVTCPPKTSPAEM